jgi:alkylation response protein AidB-like acyl-CoA dehydrogenase
MTSAIDAEVLAMTLDAVQRFAADALPEKLLLDLDADEEFPVKLVRDLCGETIGIQLLFIPEEYGGMGGGAFDVYRVCEAMARVDLGIATGVLATFLGSDPIRVGGTPEQQAHWMSRLAEEGLLMAYAATEPLAGSDLGALKTRADPVGDNGTVKGYKISGAKQWISNGGFADLYSVLALAPGGPSWFLVEAGTEGLSHGKPEDKHGIRDSNTAAVMLDNVYVPADQLLGGVEGQGLAQAQRVFGYTRLMVAAFGLGCGCEAMERAIEYSKERVQAGTPLSEKQGYTHKLIVPHVVRLEGGRAFIEETAARIDSGEGSLNTEGAIAKYFSSEAGNAAAEAAIQAFEDQTRCAHHDDLRRYLGDHGDDDRARSLAVAPENARRLLSCARARDGTVAHRTPHGRGSDIRTRASCHGRDARALPHWQVDPQSARAVSAR